MNLRSSWLLLGCAGLFGACGDDVKAKIDAQMHDAFVPPDAPKADFTWDEGGETLIEYQRIFKPTGLQTCYGSTPCTIQGRFTTFYWKALNPLRYDPPTNPGCNKTGLDTPSDADDRFPMGMGTGTPPQHTYLDVGQPMITGGMMPMVTPLGANPGVDGFNRHHDGIYHFVAVPQVAPGNTNTGEVYLGNYDAPYSLTLGGSSEWPAQAFNDAFYEPPEYTAVSPGFAGAPIPAGTDLVFTWATPNAPTHRPQDGSALNMVLALVVPGIGPVVECRDDNPFVHTQITVPAALVDYYRGFFPTAGGATTGLMARALVSHRIQELTDGTIHNHKRMDFISTWCLVVPTSFP